MRFWRDGKQKSWIIIKNVDANDDSCAGGENFPALKIRKEFRGHCYQKTVFGLWVLRRAHRTRQRRLILCWIEPCKRQLAIRRVRRVLKLFYLLYRDCRIWFCLNTWTEECRLTHCANAVIRCHIPSRSGPGIFCLERKRQEIFQYFLPHSFVSACNLP